VSDLRFKSAGALGSGIIGALFLTTRVQRVGQEHFEQFRRKGQPVLFVFWHGGLLPLMHYHRHENIVVLISEHEDGEYLTRVVEHNGFGAVRGSSTRGGTRGLKGLIRAARDGRDLALTPDGPKGPPGAFKTGALVVAQVTGIPVIPMAVQSSSGWRFRSWDGFLVPKPFSTVTIKYLAPLLVPRDSTREGLDLIAREIGTSLNACTERFDT
jgi:lysophospholipid acyltransferase (LPLAT)-like uncharacterized protein